MNEESVNRVDSVACHREEAKRKKPWHAPVVETVYVRETEAGTNTPSSDNPFMVS